MVSGGGDRAEGDVRSRGLNKEFIALEAVDSLTEFLFGWIRIGFLNRVIRHMYDDKYIVLRS